MECVQNKNGFCQAAMPLVNTHSVTSQGVLFNEGLSFLFICKKGKRSTSNPEQK